MLTIPTPPEEWQRLKALRALGVLDTDPDPELDSITVLAADLFEVPIALISLVDEHRQWFKSKVGLDIDETERELAFCGYSILSDDLLVILDASEDPRFKDHPMVVGAPHLRFYAAAPLVLSGGERVGTLCILSDQPRANFGAREARALQTLARQVVSFFESRRTLREQRIANLIADSAQDAFVAADTKGDITYWNRGAEMLFGYSNAEAVGQPLDIIIPSEHRGSHISGMKRLAAGGAPEHGWALKHELRPSDAVTRPAPPRGGVWTRISRRDEVRCSSGHRRQTYTFLRWFERKIAKMIRPKATSRTRKSGLRSSTGIWVTASHA